METQGIVEVDSPDLTVGPGCRFQYGDDTAEVVETLVG